MRFFLNFAAIILSLALSAAALAQDAAPVNEAPMRAVNAETLAQDGEQIKIWGIERVEGAGPDFKLRARTALDNAIGGGAVQCEARAREGARVLAQCVNAADIDLGLLMLQQGYVTADRAAIAGTVFENPYIEAEAGAQRRNLGIWRAREAAAGAPDNSFLPLLNTVLLLGLAAAFAAFFSLSLRRLKGIAEHQARGLDLAAQEQVLREKERSILAAMLDAEIKANKAKIEAYLVVYEEMLKNLRSPESDSRQRKSGDIVQQEPVLARTVYDRSIDRLDMLDGGLAAAMVDFYARVTAEPGYTEIEPGAPAEEAAAVVEDALANGRALSALADDLIEAFAESGLVSDRRQD